MSSRVQLLVGTRKGAFIYTSDEKRERWRQSEPVLRGWAVFHMAADARSDPPRLYAAANHPVWGPAVAKSTDGGESWDWRSEGLGFPKDMGVAVQSVWQIRPGHESEPGVVYAGTTPAGLFRSEDWGASWTSNDAINRHEYRSFWQPVPDAPLSIMSIWAGQGLEAAQRMVEAAGNKPGMGCVHSIEIDPRDAARMYVAISAGGAYASSDRGASWELFTIKATSPQIRMLISQAAARTPPGVDPAAGFDMHCLRLDTKNPERLWTQAHTGVFRSDDRARTWHDVTTGLPSFHGFPVAVTRREPDAAYVVPLELDEFRVCPGQFTVYRTRDRGTTWEALTKGLPGPGDYQSVYREGLDTDGLEPEGVYVGTSNGQVYASADGGDHWQRLPGTLPPVLSMTCAAV
jgi:photosystem II stability/assembly factor-like uncharacterized protein